MISERLLTSVLRRMTQQQLTFSPGAIGKLPSAQPGHKYLLYLHVPFCESLCTYCSFNRFVFQNNLAQNYYQQLRQELKIAAEAGYQFESMYIGGGTPTVLIDELLKTIDTAVSLFDIHEISCETNPNHLNEEYVGKLRGRIQRLSVGMQSFDNSLLRQMGRLCKFGSGEENLKKFQEAAGWFPAFNLDMIFNFPQQTEEGLRRDIKMVIASGVNQVSFYPLMTAPGVKRSIQNNIGKVDYTREAAFYQIISEGLQGHFTPTSAWTFSREKNAPIDEYIVNSEEYVGLGSGSFSYLGGALYVNTFSLGDYEQLVSSGKFSGIGVRNFGKLDRMRYRFMMDLFGLGLDKQRFIKDFGVSVEQGLPVEMAFMSLAGAFTRSNSRQIQLTPTGRYLLVAMMREFFSAVDRVREQARNALSPEERALIQICENPDLQPEVSSDAAI